MLATCSFDRTACIWEEQGQYEQILYLLTHSKLQSIKYDVNTCTKTQYAVLNEVKVGLNSLCVTDFNICM